MSFIILILLLGYTLSLLGLAMPALHYRPHHRALIDSKKDIAFTVIVVYRNEQATLPRLLNDLKRQSYSKNLIEIILVNDDSTDDSCEIAQTFKENSTDQSVVLLDRLIHSTSAKKDGISQAIHTATHEHILVTDADCELPHEWMASYNEHYKKYAHTLFIAGPLAITGSGFIARLQQLEMVALQTITAGSFAIRQPFICNGANMSFTKSAFKQVQGYSGNDHISSGDDIFLLEKLAAENVIQCHYLKSSEAIVKTRAKSSWQSMIAQRARWARKGNETKSLLNKLIATHVAAINLLFFVMPVCYWLDGISKNLLLSFYLLKLFTDFIVLLVGTQFFVTQRWSRVFLLQYFVYPLVVLAIVLQSLKKIKWRGRVIDQNDV